MGCIPCDQSGQIFVNSITWDTSCCTKFCRLQTQRHLAEDRMLISCPYLQEDPFDSSRLTSWTRQRSHLISILSTNLSIHPCQSIHHLHFLFLHLSVFLSAYLCIYLCVCLNINLFFHLCTKNVHTHTRIQTHTEQCTGSRSWVVEISIALLKNACRLIIALSSGLESRIILACTTLFTCLINCGPACERERCCASSHYTCLIKYGPACER